MEADPDFWLGWTALEEAPLDDETETPEDAEAVDAAREQARNGDVVAWEDVRSTVYFVAADVATR